MVDPHSPSAVIRRHFVLAASLLFMVIGTGSIYFLVVALKLISAEFEWPRVIASTVGVVRSRSLIFRARIAAGPVVSVASMSRVFPSLYEEHRDSYRGKGLKDLCDEMFAFKVARRQQEVLYAAFGECVWGWLSVCVCVFCCFYVYCYFC